MSGKEQFIQEVEEAIENSKRKGIEAFQCYFNTSEFGIHFDLIEKDEDTDVWAPKKGVQLVCLGSYRDSDDSTYEYYCIITDGGCYFLKHWSHNLQYAPDNIQYIDNLPNYVLVNYRNNEVYNQ
jgi:hypothetical protein